MKKSLCFDDVLLVPQHFRGKSRSEIDLSTSISGLKLKIPLIAANMPAVCEEKMAIALGKRGGLGIIHRMCEIEREVEIVKAAKRENVQVGASIGISDDWLSRSQALIEAKVDLICLDVAFFAQDRAHEVALNFMKWFPEMPFVVGNIATESHVSMFENKCFFRHKISYKASVGSGAMCLTRINTGTGQNTLQAIMNCNEFRTTQKYDFNLIADGGHKTSGDCVKSLAAGANALMIGSLFAACVEAPGDVVDGKKKYFGNASAAGKAFANMKIDHIEGEESWYPCKGSVNDVIDSLLDGIRSGMSYCGAMNLEELRRNAEFVEITPAGHRESGAHGKK